MGGCQGAAMWLLRLVPDSTTIIIIIIIIIIINNCTIKLFKKKSITKYITTAIVILYCKI